MWLCVYVRRGIASRTRSRAAGHLRAVRLAAEHHRADLAAAHPACLVQGDSERLTGVLERRDLREQGAGVHVDGVPADRGQHRQSGSPQRLAEVPGRADSVSQIVVVDNFAQPLGERLEVAAGQPAVSRETLR